MDRHVKGPVHRLQDYATRAITLNIGYLTDLGDMEYRLVKDLLMACKVPGQLLEIEENSPHLREADQEVWQHHVLRDFGHIMNAWTNDEMDEPESWRTLYLDEREKEQRRMEDAAGRLREKLQGLKEAKQAKRTVVTDALAPPRKKARWGAGLASSSGSSSASSILARAKNEARSSLTARNARLTSGGVSRPRSSASLGGVSTNPRLTRAFPPIPSEMRTLKRPSLASSTSAAASRSHSMPILSAKSAGSSPASFLPPASPTQSSFASLVLRRPSTGGGALSPPPHSPSFTSSSSALSPPPSHAMSRPVPPQPINFFGAAPTKPPAAKAITTVRKVLRPPSMSQKQPPYAAPPKQSSVHPPRAAKPPSAPPHHAPSHPAASASKPKASIFMPKNRAFSQLPSGQVRR